MMNLVFIQFIVVFLVDIAEGWKLPTSIINYFLTGKFEGRRIKPFSCSLCCTFWAGLLYVILAGIPFFSGLFFVCLLSALTPATLGLFYFIYDNLITLTNKRL